MRSDGHIDFSVSSGPIGVAMGIYPPGTSIPMKRFENTQLIKVKLELSLLKHIHLMKKLSTIKQIKSKLTLIENNGIKEN